MQAFAGGANALYARNSYGNAIDAEGTGIGILGRSPASSLTYPLVLTDKNGNDLLYVASSGNVHYHAT